DGLGYPPAVGGAFGQEGDRQVQVGGGLHVGEDVPHAQHLRDVTEPGEAALDPEAGAALGGQFNLGDDLAQGGCPAVGHPDTGGVEQVRAQVRLHHVRLGDRVGDRGRGRECDHPVAVAPAQVADLHVQVGGAHRAVDGRVGDVGRRAQVLVAVGLVDAE